MNGNQSERKTSYWLVSFVCLFLYFGVAITRIQRVRVLHTDRIKDSNVLSIKYDNNWCMSFLIKHVLKTKQRTLHIYNKVFKTYVLF